jgi:ElaB/YqjD/DUF883 family membrane-anchored ribosome-binding protein
MADKLQPIADAATTALDRPTELAQTEREIERTRARVSRSMMALRNAVAKQTDWREWVRERPAVFVVGAFALGMFFGLRSSGRRAARPGS